MQYDGLIVRAETSALATPFLGQPLRIVNVGGAKTVAPWPRIDTDNSAVALLAVNHLLDRGYRRFGFVGLRDCEWSQSRRGTFKDELGRRGLDCESLDVSVRGPARFLARRDRQSLLQWVRQLPRPAGVLACNDQCGRAVLDACRDLGVSVPDEVGVIGVNNDELICELCAPPLSSIEANCELIGYAAAETLRAMLQGQAPKVHETLITPTTVVGRRSTDATAVRDPVVAEAIRFIRTYACTNISSADVARHVQVSRRYLELQFQRTLGRPPHAEILRIRLETAQRLLGETDWDLQTVAERAGFTQASHMSDMFHRRLRIRPGEYRRRIQNRSAPQ
jgi:LacI family transcriptional regulator